VGSQFIINLHNAFHHVCVLILGMHEWCLVTGAKYRVEFSVVWCTQLNGDEFCPNRTVTQQTSLFVWNTICWIRVMNIWDP